MNIQNGLKLEASDHYKYKKKVNQTKVLIVIHRNTLKIIIPLTWVHRDDV